jgi:hypothetical protein
MTKNQSNACAVCGEQVTTATRIQGFLAWESDTGETIGKETVLVMHPECYMGMEPEDRDRLLTEAAKAQMP